MNDSKLKLRLKNFRCHTDFQLSFPEKGLVLLSGKNGKGKSTILEAIYYALYGDVKKPCFFGATSCSVELEYKNFTIKRSTRPNRLILSYKEKEYEDKVAQNIIDEKLMSCHEFLASSYIRQNQQTSILRLTPTEQLSFIKNISFDSEQTNKIKEIIKSFIKDAANDGLRLQTKIEDLEKNLKELQHKSIRAQYTVDAPPIDDEEEFLENCNEVDIELKKYTDIKKKKEIELKEAEKEVEKQKVSRNKIELLDQEIKNLEKEIEENNEDFNKDELEKELEKMRKSFEDSCLETILYEKQDELEDLQLQTIKISHNYNERYQKSIHYAKLKEKTDKILKEYSQNEVSQHEVKKLLQDIVYECPSCNTHLIVNKNKLKKTKKDVSSGTLIEDDKREILRNFLSTKEYDIEKEKERYLKNVELEKEKREIEEKCKKLQKEISVLEQYEGVENHVEQKDIRKLEKKFEKVLQKETEINLIRKRLEKRKDMRKELNTDSVPIHINVNKIREELDKALKKIEKLLKKKNEHSEIKLKLERYKGYLQYQHRIDETIDKIKELQELKLKTDQRSKKLGMVRDKSNQAEVLALESTVSSINSYARDYLENMFNDPIEIFLETFKETNKGVAPKMNVVISHKGSEYDTVDQLSGGERQKCELAFELAVNTLLGSNILMLDECINNLDNEFNTEILEMLKEHANRENKLIIVISHECVSGIFDKIVEL